MTRIFVIIGFGLLARLIMILNGDIYLNNEKGHVRSDCYAQTKGICEFNNDVYRIASEKL